MSQWQSIITHIQKRLPQAYFEDGLPGGMVTIDFSDGRTQTVVMGHSIDAGGTEVLELTSVVGEADDVPLLKLLRRARELNAAVSIAGNNVLVFHTIYIDPSQPVSPNALFHGIDIVSSHSDILEEEFFVVDEN